MATGQLKKKSALAFFNEVAISQIFPLIDGCKYRNCRQTKYRMVFLFYFTVVLLILKINCKN